MPYGRITILRGYTIMKKILLAGIAALFLAGGTAHATGPDDCAVVVQTRDGFLNVREAPTMKSKIIAKLYPMDMVWADAYECIIEECEIKGWRHIGEVTRSSGDGKPQKLRGWVGEKYLKYIGYRTCKQ